MVLKCYFKVRIQHNIVFIDSSIGYLQVNRINLCKNVIRAVDREQGRHSAINGLSHFRASESYLRP
jgi:hypothetical protein